MRVLLLSATTGGGHMRAAQALKDYIMSKDPDSVVEIYDTIQYVSPMLNKAVTNGYVYMATKTPRIFGGMYKSTDKKTPFTQSFEAALGVLRKKLQPGIESFNPDVVVTTHSFATEIASAVKTKENVHFPLISILTDFAVHKTYINEGVDAYILSSEEMVGQMIERGVHKDVLYPYGIPINNKFFNKIDRAKAVEDEQLDPELPTLLLMAGSFGVTDVLKVYHKIVKSTADFQIIAITGKNEKLYETFEKYLSKIDLNNTMYELSKMYPSMKQQKSDYRNSRERKPSKPTRLLYYTDDVEKYMQMSDLIVTKPGGLTVTEAIATGLPMAIFKAIPGQEVQNADFLVRNGMAVKINKDKTCTDTITELLTKPEKLNAMRTAVRNHSNGNSAAKVYALMEELIAKYREDDRDRQSAPSDND